MKRDNWSLTLAILSGIGAIASIVVLVVLSNRMITSGVTTARIWAVVGIVVSFLICTALFGVVFTLLKGNKKQAVLEEDKVTNEEK